MFRYAWIVFIGLMGLNAWTFWRAAEKEIARNSRLEPGYRSILRGFLIYGNIPWIVMGIGVLVGGVPSVFHFMNPRNGPFVIAWWISAMAIGVASVYWILFRDGAEMLLRHPGLMNPAVTKAWQVKALAVVSFAGSLAGFLIAYLLDFQPPV